VITTPSKIPAILEAMVSLPNCPSLAPYSVSTVGEYVYVPPGHFLSVGGLFTDER
jgi:hypothetical protein